MEDVNRWYNYARGIEEISYRRLSSLEEQEKTRTQLAAILSNYPEIASQSVPSDITQIREFRDDERERMHTQFDDIVFRYPGIQTIDTGGYILPSEWPLPLFLDKLIHKATGTKLRIIPVNRHSSYDDQHFMLSSMVDNAYEHGNRLNMKKKVYLLWHRCGVSKNICVVDEGEVEFDFDKQVKKRRALAASFGKWDDTSGTDYLKEYSKEFEYFSIVDKTPTKKGTLLRIVLEKPEQKPKTTEECNYLGHQLFA